MDTFILFVMLCSPGNMSSCEVVYANAHVDELSCKTELVSHIKRNDHIMLDTVTTGMCIEGSLADYCDIVDPRIESDDMYAECDDYYHTDGME